ncbi:MAG TPA: PAS domain-containing protein, partial [Gemmatimonadaceae bacterium]|nr:PAS domain-containing protein [Gemmatimonadaceae bacterium]
MPHLADPLAVAAVHRSEPLDTSFEPPLDRLTRLAARTLGVPAAFVSVADDEVHRVRSVHGLAPLPARALPPSVCRLVAASGTPILVNDVRAHPELHDLSTVAEREVVAFAGVPLVDADGRLLGTLCALDWAPRAWSAGDEELLGDLAIALARELAGARHERGVGEQRTRELVDGLDAIVWECDPRTFLFTFVNRRAEEMLGYPLEQWYTDPMLWVGMIHPDDREHTVLYCQVETRERRDHTFEYRVLTADGRVLWLRDVVKLVLDENGEPWRLRGVMLDITERKKAE